MAFIQNPNLATPAIDNRPAVVEDRPAVVEDRPAVVEDRLEEEEDKLVLEPAQREPVQEPRGIDLLGTGLKPRGSITPERAAFREGVREPVQEPVEEPSDLTVGDVFGRVILKGVGIEPEPAKGLTLEPAEPVVDPLGFLKPQVDISREGIYRAAFKEELEETRQLDIDDRKNYILFELLHKKQNSDSNKEYALWINKLINRRYLDNVQSSREDIYGTTHSRQRNPYFHNPIQFILDSRQDYLPLKIWSEETGQFELFSLKPDGEFLISPEFKGAEGGQLYFDPKAGSIDPNTQRPIGAFQYWETTGEQFSSELDTISKAIQRGAAEFPIFAVNIAGLIDMGLNYTVLGGARGGQWVFNQLGLDWNIEVEKDFDEAMERTAQGMSEFTQEYELAIAPWRDTIGSFANPDSTFEERVIEEIIVALPLTIPLLRQVVKSGKRDAARYIRAIQKYESMIETSGIKNIQHAAARMDNIRYRLKQTGKVDDDIIDDLYNLPDEEAVEIISNAIGRAHADDFIQTKNYFKQQAVVDNPKFAKEAQRYLRTPAKVAAARGGVSELTSIREVRAVANSEIMMNVGFVAGEDMFPDDPLLQMGAALFGGWWGMRGQHYLLNDGPMGVTKKARSYFGLNDGNWEIFLYGLNRGFAEIPYISRSQRIKASHRAENQILKYFGVYNEFVQKFGKKATLDQKRSFSHQYASSRKEFQGLVNLVQKTEEWLKGMPADQVREILEKAEEIQITVKSLREKGYTGKHLNETLSNMFAIPVLNVLEQQLLGRINAGLKLQINHVPIMAEYYNILKMKQENLDAVREILEKLGDVENLGPSTLKFRNHMRAYYAKESQKLTTSRDNLNETINRRFSQFKSMITSGVSTMITKMRNDDLLDTAIDFKRMNNLPDQLAHTKAANERLGGILEPLLKEIDIAYGKVNYSYEFKSTDEMASLLEEIVDQTIRTPDPTRTVVGVQPRAYQARKILHSARYKFITKQLEEKPNLNDQLDYLDELRATVLERDPGASKANRVLSQRSQAQFENHIADLMEAGEYEQIGNAINSRAIKLAQVDAKNSGIGAVYTMGEFSQLRSFVTAKSVSHSSGRIRYNYREIREMMDELIETADPLDVNELTKLENANVIYRKYKGVFGRDIGKELVQQDEQGFYRYGNNYFDSDMNPVTIFDDNVQHVVPSENDLFGHFLAPFFKSRPNFDKMNRGFDVFMDIFAKEDGTISAIDAELLLDNFALQVSMLRGSGVNSIQKIEKIAYENFMARYGKKIEQSLFIKDASRLERFQNARKLYNIIIPYSDDEALQIARLEHHKTNAIDLLNDEKLQAVNILKKFFTLREEAMKGSFFHDVSVDKINSPEDMVRILFGKGKQGAESRIKADPGMRPLYAEESIEDLRRKGLVLRGVDPKEVIGPIDDAPLKHNFRQALDHLDDALKEGDINEIEHRNLKKALGTFLMHDMITEVFTHTNRQNYNLTPGELASGIFGINHIAQPEALVGQGAEALSKRYKAAFTEYEVNAARMQDYLENNREAFEALFDKEHVKNINDAFKTSWAMGTEQMGMDFTGLFQGYSASTLQSLFWAVARNVVSMRFVAGMLGFQAYRQGTTNFFRELLTNKSNTAILMKALRSRAALTDAQEASFKKVFTASYGPHVASYINRDMMERIKEEWQKDQEESKTLQDVRRESGQTRDIAGLDKLRAWQAGVPVEELPEDPYKRRISAAILGTTQQQIGEGVNPTTLARQMVELEQARNLPPDPRTQWRQAKELFGERRVPLDWRPS